MQFAGHTSYTSNKSNTIKASNASKTSASVSRLSSYLNLFIKEDFFGKNVCRASDKSYLEVPDTGIGIQEMRHKTLQYKQWGQEGLAQYKLYNTIQNNRTRTLGSKEVDTKTNIR